MRTRTKHRILSVLLIAFAILLPCGSAFADEYVSSDNFVITGKYADGFRLTTNQENIFSMEGCAPGDYYTGEIVVENISGATMEIRILEIRNMIEESDLFDCLDLSIRLGNDLLYDGSYGGTDIPVTEFFKVKHGESITFDIYVSFPGNAGNVYQGTVMDSLWIFEATHPGFGGGGFIPDKEPEEEPVKPDEPADPEEPKEDEEIIVPGQPVEPDKPKEDKPGIKTGVEFIDNNSVPIMGFFAAMLAFVIAFILIRKAKRNEN